MTFHHLSSPYEKFYSSSSEKERAYEMDKISRFFIFRIKMSLNNIAIIITMRGRNTW